MLAATAPVSVADLAARIRRRAGLQTTPDTLARELTRRYALAQARRLAQAARGDADAATVAGAAARVREAVGHARLAVAARRDPGAALRLWDDVRGEAAAAAGGFSRVLARGLGLTAADAAQEGFLKFLAALPGFDPRRATFRTYYRRVVRHHVLDLARRARVRPAPAPLGGDGAAAEPPDTRHPDPADAAAGSATARALAAAVADVCGRLQAEHGAERVAAFRLRRLGGLRLAEVADRVGRCVAWVYRADLAVARAFAAHFRARYPALVREVAP